MRHLCTIMQKVVDPLGYVERVLYLCTHDCRSGLSVIRCVCKCMIIKCHNQILCPFSYRMSERGCSFVRMRPSEYDTNKSYTKRMGVSICSIRQRDNDLPTQKPKANIVSRAKSKMPCDVIPRTRLSSRPCRMLVIVCQAWTWKAT